MSIAKNYIPHIDGIRAVSVIAVVFFHFHLLGFTGGYIGVDVFFTISGYLIIGSIVGQVEAGKFKASSFWGRRVRRLFPAIFAVLFLSFVAGLLLMSPSDLAKLSTDSIYGLISLINFTLLGSTDYFDIQGFNEPLLHFWSLAVEEQFYFVFPLVALGILACVGRRGNYKTTITWVLLILSVLSLVGAEYALRSGNPLFAYYMMPTRFFQLALGGVLATALQSDVFRERRTQLPALIHDLVVVAAIATIFLLSLTFTKITPFPGINAIWPTLAALGLLYSGGHSRLSFGLDNPVSAHLGKLSYALYLVHWPVWSFMCYYFDRVLTLPETIFALAMTYFISLFIYKCIESPVRFSPIFEGHRLYAIVAPATLAAAGIFVATISQNGWIDRIPANQRAFSADAGEFHKTNFGGVGYRSGLVVKLGNPLAEPEFLLIGDSKAGQFAFGLDKALLKRNRSAEMITQNGCSFITGIGRIHNGKRDINCQTVTQKMRNHVATSDLPIISVRSWRYLARDGFQHYVFGGDNDGALVTEAEFLSGHIKLLDDLTSNGRRVFLLGENHFFSATTTMSDCLSRPTYFGLPCAQDANVPAANHTPSSIEDSLEVYSRNHENINFIAAIDVFCPDGTCRSVASDGRILHSDTDHLSKEGSKDVALTILEIIGLGLGKGPELGELRAVDDIMKAIISNWKSGHANTLNADLNDLIIFSNDPKDFYHFVNGLWNGTDKVEKNRELAVPVAEHLSDKTDETLSSYVAGMAYWWGTGGVEKDFDKTIMYWTRPSQAKNAAVQFRLAEIYLNPRLPQFDREKGLTRLNMSADLGYELAINLQKEIGIE